MKSCDQYQFDIPDMLDGTITDTDRAAFDNHASTCPDCAEALHQYRAMLDTMTSYARPASLSCGEEAFLDRLDHTIAESVEKVTQYEHAEAGRPVWFRLLPGTPSRIAAAAAAALVAGLFIGHEIFSPGSYLHPHSSITADRTESQPSAEERAEQFIGSAERILLSMVNTDIDEELPYRPSFDRQRSLSRDLLNEATYIREGLAAGSADHARLLDLMDNLEVVLMQIAALETDYTADDLAFIQSSAERKAVLFKMNLDAVLSTGVSPATADTRPENDAPEQTSTLQFY